MSKVLNIIDILSAGVVDLSSEQQISNKVINSSVLTNTVGLVPNIEVFTFGTSWVIPENMRIEGMRFKITCIGGGGGSGGTGTTVGQAGGGGGSGGLTIGYFSYIPGIDTVLLSVGNGGSAGQTGGNGGPGGNTIVTYDTTTFVANGGSGGQANGAGGIGGIASGGVLNIVGGSGASGGTMSELTNYVNDGGNTPLGYGFGGRMSPISSGASGVMGTGYGAGAAGGRNGTSTTSRQGAAGQAGAIIIEY